MKELTDAVEKNSDQETLSMKDQIIDRKQQITDSYEKVNNPPVQQAAIEFVPFEVVLPLLGFLCLVDPHNCKVVNLPMCFITYKDSNTE